MRKREVEPEILDGIAETGIDVAGMDQTLQDSLLRMIFVCCDPLVPAESQTALALKTLCGFSIAETARALVSTPESIAKRITRAKTRLRESNLQLEQVSDEEICDRLPAVLRVIYLLFNEGYSSTQADRLIREELCEEAVRLALLLAEHPLTKCSTTAAFIALLLFHASRLDARVDNNGVIMLFHQQRVADWDLRLLREAYIWFERSTQTGEVSRYHAEAMIAAEHCRGKLNNQTDWKTIRRAYDLLCRMAPSPIHELNRAIAIAKEDGAPAGLDALSRIDSQQLAQNYYLWHATAGELYALADQHDAAEQALRRAWTLAPTSAEKELICRKIDKLST
ncbi:MAG: RNA polymerase sigma factor [Aureliella sp.]